MVSKTFTMAYENVINTKLYSWSAIVRYSLPLLIVLLIAGCNKIDWKNVDNENGHGNGFGSISSDMVLTWNNAAVHMVTATPQDPPNPPIPPFYDSRFFAMVGISMHDALNSIIPKYQTYALKNTRDKHADPNVAVAQAAHDVIVAAYGTLNAPAFFTPQSVKDDIESLLASSLSKTPNGDAKTRGIALGKAAAAAIIQLRSTDGSNNVYFPVTEGTLPGEYRFTAPFNGPPFNGYYESPGWGKVKPFGLQSSAQFMPPPPYAVNSGDYTKDYLEVKHLGCMSCSDRTSEQSEIALFWKESSSIGWNRIATIIGKQKKLDAFRFARLIALVNMSEADSYIASAETKLFYFYWRPVTAIQLGDNDGNTHTPGDATWEVMAPPTPPVADYPSAHSSAGGAGAAAMAIFFGTDDLNFTTTSLSLPNVSRSFHHISDAATENALSRIYIGYHFRKACFAGRTMGVYIGSYIANGSLKQN